MSEEECAKPSDEVILTQLGSAVLLCWNELPLAAQTKILDQADDMIGLAPIPGVRDRIIGPLLRRDRV